MTIEEQLRDKLERVRSEPQAWIPLPMLAVCGSDHAYDQSRYQACPACGQEDRIHVSRALILWKGEV